MPRTSERQILLKQIDHLIFLTVVYKDLELIGSDSEKKMEDEIEELLDLKALLLSSRFLNQRVSMYAFLLFILDQNQRIIDVSSSRYLTMNSSNKFD